MTEFQLGIDLARWQVKPNWKNIWETVPCYKDGKPANAPCVSFAHIKATHGLGVDPEFRRNAEESTKTIPDKCARGFYTWFIPTLDPLQQANFLVNVISGYRLKRQELLIGIDLEDDAGGRVRGKDYVIAVKECVEEIEQRRGDSVLLYTGKWFWQQIGNPDDEWFAKRKLWHSEYPGRIPGPTEFGHLPLPWASRNIRETLWQFDGDKGLYMTAECDMSNQIIDYDFSRFMGTRQNLFESIVESYDPIGYRDFGWSPQTSPHTVLPDIIPETKDE